MNKDIILCEFLYTAVQSYLDNNPVNYLEIGVFNGAGFGRIARNNLNINCIGIDPFIEDGWTSAGSNVDIGQSMPIQYQYAHENIQGLSNAHLHIETSYKFFENLTRDYIESAKIGVVLIDGAHNYDCVVNDFKLAMSVIDNKQGLIVVDDLHIHGVSQAYEEFKNGNQRIDSIESISNTAVSIFIKSE